jgi:hypothetical protein
MNVTTARDTSRHTIQRTAVCEERGYTMAIGDITMLIDYAAGKFAGAAIEVITIYLILSTLIKLFFEFGRRK